MQYVRSISGSVSKTWNSINPATLSGAIDVIVIEQEDGKPPPGSDETLMHAAADRPDSRNTCMLAVPCPFRQILPPSAVREEGRLACLQQQKRPSRDGTSCANRSFFRSSSVSMGSSKTMP